MLEPSLGLVLFLTYVLVSSLIGGAWSGYAYQCGVKAGAQLREGGSGGSCGWASGWGGMRHAGPSVAGAETSPSIQA